jgi:hypothetical protein
MQGIGVAARERVEAGLRRTVDRVELARPDRRHRGEHHDRAAPSLPHRLAEGQQRGDVAGEVGLDHGGGQSHVPLSLLLREQDAGRRDHQVGYPAVADLRGERLVGIRVRRVVLGDRYPGIREVGPPGGRSGLRARYSGGFCHRGRNRAAVQRLPGRLKPLRVPAGQDDLRAWVQLER